MVLTLVAGDFSYLAAWFLPHATVQWDYLLWPTNFLSPTMEVLHFNTWTPALPIFYMALYALICGLQGRTWGWIVMSAVLLAVLFQFKPFAYAVVLAGVSAALLFSRNDSDGRRRLAAVLGLAVVFAMPFLYSIATLPVEDRRSRFLLDYFLLPKRMLIKLDLTDTFAQLGARLAPAVLLQTPIALALATGLFFLVGLGIRWLALPGLWRSLRGSDPLAGSIPNPAMAGAQNPSRRLPKRIGSDMLPWRVLAWSAVAGVIIPFVLVTDPYVDTLNFYQCGLYLLWIFTGVALTSFMSRHRLTGVVAVAIAVAVSVPSSLHFLDMKWHERERPVVASLTSGEAVIADYLRTTDPETTVILHDRPTAPSLIAVVSERRVVLGWSRQYYAVGSADRSRDVNDFFGSMGLNPIETFEVLRRYNVTHVVVETARDHVHPDVISRLQPVLHADSATLYAVPPAAQ
jgi:hypothetical protein